MKNVNTNNNILVIGVFLTILIIVGGTFAYWSWSTSEAQKTNVVFTLTQDFACAVDGGGDITQADAFIAPSNCLNSAGEVSENVIMREVTVTPTIFRNNLTIYMELWLEIKSLQEGLANSSNFKYAFTTSNASCDTGVVETGNLKGLTKGDTKLLLSRNFSNSQPKKYYLWIWLDAAETSQTTMNQSFSLTLGGACTDNQILVVPEGGTYMVGTPEEEVNPSPMSYSMKKLATNNVCNYENAVVYNSGEVVNVVPSTCDKYLFGDYEYIYNAHLINQSVAIDESLEGWGVININSTNSSPGQILSTINEKDVVSMSETFMNSYIITAPVIPNTIKNMNSTFNGCSALKGTIKINANPSTYSNIFANTSNLIKIVGTSLKLNEMTNSANNGNVTIGDNAQEAPQLDDGMIPVKLSSDGTVTTVSSSEPTWYDYENKEWANVVLVKNSGIKTRSYYKQNVGVEVNQDDILAYYVWIPRYKYQIWTTTNSSNGAEQTIEIEFELANESMSSGTEVGEWRTHPAFGWDNNNNGNIDSGETVAGIWVGKFETTGNATTPTILPNKSSLRNQRHSAQFATSQKFSASNNIYGLSSTSTNAHMVKNSEWGAVAYLSHSKYGINGEIYINNSSGFYTGRSGGNVSGKVNALSTQFSDQTSNNQYNDFGYYTWLGEKIDSDGVFLEFASDRTLGTKASTTGNVSGIYDLSGGAHENVMAYYSGANSNYATNPDVYFGYTASANMAKFTSLLEFKYWDEYTSTDISTACNGGLCYGHALSEVLGWYGDAFAFIGADNPWYIRGGGVDNGSYSGAFRFAGSWGMPANGFVSFRSALVIGYGS